MLRGPWLNSLKTTLEKRKRPSKRRSSPFTAPVEALEERVLLAASPSWYDLDSTTRVLTVRGGEGADRLAVINGPSDTIVVSLTLNGEATPRRQSLPKAAVQRINFFGDFGNDFFSNQASVDAVLYGGAGFNRVDGARLATDPVAEGRAYEDRVYAEMLSRFRDSYGFVVSEKDGQPIEDRGDAVIFTGLATAVSAIRGDAVTTLELLRTLRDRPFINELGRIRLIRHPDVWDYRQTPDGQFVRHRHAPLSKDGIVGVMTGAYYAYTAPGMTDGIRRVAKEVITKYVDYLIANGWKTLDQYPESYWAKHASDSKKFANVFSNESGGLVMWKGPESFFLSPNDRYALQNVAAKMGLVTSHWAVWGGFGATLTETLGDAVQPYIKRVAGDVAAFAGARVNLWLQSLKFDQELSFHVIPGANWSLVKKQLNAEIPKAARDSIVGYVRGEIHRVLQSALDEVIAGTTKGPAKLFQLNDLLGRVIDKAIEALPNWLGSARWKPLVTSALQQGLPWLKGDILGELLAFRLSHDLAKTDEIVAHLSFWPTLLMFETQPEFVDLLGWSVKDVDGYLNDVTSLNLDFWKKDFYRMDMMLYGWLAGSPAKVDWWQQKFETDPRFDSLAYAWKKSHSENVEKILAGKDSATHRIDYLLLTALERSGRPVAASVVISGWTTRWQESLKTAAQEVLAGAKKTWDDLRTNPAAFARKLRSEFNASLVDIARALKAHLALPLVDIAKILRNELQATILEVAKILRTELQASYTQIAKILRDNLGVGVVDTAKVLWNDLRAPLGDVAKALRDGLGQGYVAIAKLLSKDLSISVYDTAKALYNSSGLNLSFYDTAKALYSSSGANLSFYAVAKVLYSSSGISIGYYNVAKALYSSSGLNLGFYDVAKALYSSSGADLSFYAVAKALYSSSGISIGYYNTAKALYNSSGIDLSFYDTAKALYSSSGADLSFYTVAKALYSSSGISIGYYNVAKALYSSSGLNLGYYSVAKALYSSSGADLGYFSVAKALYNSGGLGLSIQSVAKALYSSSGLDLSMFQVARTLSSSSGLGQNIYNTAKVLYNGIGLNSYQLANALYSASGSDLSFYDTAKALFNSGLGLNSFDVAGALRHGAGLGLYDVARAIYNRSGMNLSLNDTASALYNGIGGMTWLNALAIVRAIT